MADLTIHHGLDPRQIDAAAELYWQAFGDKLDRVLWPEPCALQWLRAALHPSHAFTAFKGDRLVGLVGYRNAQGSFVEGGLAPLMQSFGWYGGLWRSLAMMPLERRTAPEELGLDGICIQPELRGQGVGSRLIETVTAFAKDQGYHRLSLDVVEGNDAALKLYIRLGFVPTARQALGPFAMLYGFTASQRMERAL